MVLKSQGECCCVGRKIYLVLEAPNVFRVGRRHRLQHPLNSFGTGVTFPINRSRKSSFRLSNCSRGVAPTIGSSMSEVRLESWTPLRTGQATNRVAAFWCPLLAVAHILSAAARACAPAPV